MNNRGFTLVELIATIVLLAIVASIGTYSIITIINSTKEQNYNNLIKNIKDASESYYLECRYSTPDSSVTGVSCTKGADGKYTVTLGNLVTYGFLTGNNKDNSGAYSLLNPKTSEDISSCSIKISSTNGTTTVTAVSTSSGCPTQAEYDG